MRKKQNVLQPYKITFFFKIRKSTNFSIFFRLKDLLTAATSQSVKQCRIRLQGADCDDGLDYTVNDICIQGQCRGQQDYCKKHGVDCEPHTSCLISGSCKAETGHCAYTAQPDGTLCDDDRKNTANDKCLDGRCVGTPVDLCASAECQAQNDCWTDPVCDAETGDCLSWPKANNAPCDDGRADTTADRCIESVCMGVPPEQEFDSLGIGECAERVPSPTGDGIVSQYFPNGARVTYGAEFSGEVNGVPLSDLDGVVLSTSGSMVYVRFAFRPGLQNTVNDQKAKCQPVQLADGCQTFETDV